MAKKVTKKGELVLGGQPDVILMPPKAFDDFRKLFDPDYAKKYYAKCAKFESLFHKEVIFEHKGSKVRWKVIKTFKHSGTGEVRCRIQSLSSKQTRELSREMFSDYEMIDAPDAVKVLFMGEKNE